MEFPKTFFCYFEFHLLVLLTYTNASDKNSGEIRVSLSSAEEAKAGGNQIPQQVQPGGSEAICDNDRVIISEADTKVRPTEQQQSISHHHPDICTFVNGKE